MSVPRFDVDRWQARLDELRATHHVPAATLAVLADGTVHELASGVLHRETGLPATPDSLFLAGSLAKTYTATLVMQLVDSGELDLDAPVVSVLPEFGTPDPEATKTITIRQLLSHTGGVTNDFIYDAGRGDDCLAKYVEAARDVALDCPPGTAFSYGSLGYVVLGRIIEVLTGQTWDQALRDRLFTPLGLERSMTLPEEALRFRVAMGHLGQPGQDPEPAAVWDVLPRSAGPYGRVIVSAGDVARFAKMHLDGGIAADGTRILSTDAVAAMQRREIDSPDKWSVSADAWGLGWTLHDWNGIFGFGHDGSAVSQHSYLRVIPQTGVAIVLLTNGGDVARLYTDLFRELLAELADAHMPAPFAPPANPPEVDPTPLLGSYRRAGVITTISQDDTGSARIRYEFVDDLKGIAPPLEAGLVPVTPTVFAASFNLGGEAYSPVVFSTLANGTPCVYVFMRATPKAA
ncbi:serine hydrolase domain-containing protein [Saccharopolyspora sp. NPDC050389]|uniref:serine hydrolase domain-containing protein n=1 Tax=Saccharopolyspora sp. NPDC050389 TaxID=3155516 RepID=UPI0033D98D60